MTFFSPSRVEAGKRHALDPGRHVRRRLLLEEVLALPAVRVALHRERPAAQVRDEHLGDVAVVGDEVALRDPLVGPERLVEVAQPKLAPALPEHRRQRRSLPAHLGGLLVLAQPEVDRRTKPSLARPLDELDLCDELRLDPDDVATADARHLRRLRERGVSPLERLQELRAARSISASREPGADVPGPAQAAGLVNADDERAEAARAAALAPRVARDDDLLALAHLHLAPVRAPAPRLVLRVRPLGDDALEPLLARGLRAAHRRRRTAVRRARSPPPGSTSCSSRSRRSTSGRSTSGSESSSRRSKRTSTSVPAPLQEREPRSPLLVERADLAVEHRVGGATLALRRARRLPEAPGEVVAVPARQRHLAARDGDDRPESVPLRLVDPARRRAEACRRTSRASVRSGAAAAVAPSFRRSSQFFGSPSSCAGTSVHDTVEAVAVEPHGQPAVALLLDELVRAAIPDLDRAGAVLARRDRPLEVAVLQRVVLDVHGEVPLAAPERDALRDRPARERAVALEPEVVVQAARGVPLDDEARPVARTPCALPKGSGVLPGVRRAPVLVEAHLWIVASTQRFLHQLHCRSDDFPCS